MTEGLFNSLFKPSDSHSSYSKQKQPQYIAQDSVTEGFFTSLFKLTYTRLTPPKDSVTDGLFNSLSNLTYKTNIASINSQPETQ